MPKSIELKPEVEDALRFRTEVGSGSLGKRKFEVSLNIDNKAIFVFFDDAQQHVMYPIPYAEMVKTADELIPVGAKALKAKPKSVK